MQAAESPVAGQRSKNAAASNGAMIPRAPFIVKKQEPSAGATNAPESSVQGGMKASRRDEDSELDSKEKNGDLPMDANSEMQGESIRTRPTIYTQSHSVNTLNATQMSVHINRAGAINPATGKRHYN